MGRAQLGAVGCSVPPGVPTLLCCGMESFILPVDAGGQNSGIQWGRDPVGQNSEHRVPSPPAEQTLSSFGPFWATNPALGCPHPRGWGLGQLLGAGCESLTGGLAPISFATSATPLSSQLLSVPPPRFRCLSNLCFCFSVGFGVGCGQGKSTTKGLSPECIQQREFH